MVGVRRVSLPLCFFSFPVLQGAINRLCRYALLHQSWGSAGLGCVGAKDGKFTNVEPKRTKKRTCTAVRTELRVSQDVGEYVRIRQKVQPPRVFFLVARHSRRQLMSTCPLPELHVTTRLDGVLSARCIFMIHVESASFSDRLVTRILGRCVYPKAYSLSTRYALLLFVG